MAQSDTVKTKVLLVSSSAEDARFVFDAFNAEKPPRFEISCVSTVAEGTRRLEEPFDVMLLDVPASAEGVTMVKEFMGASPHGPVIVMFDAEQEEAAVECMKLGVQDCINKVSLSSFALVRAVRYALMRHGRIQNLHQASSRLETVEESLRNVMQENNQAVVIVDMDGVIKFVNKAAELLFSRSREGMEGEMFEFSVVPGKTTEIEIVKAGGLKAHIEMRAIAIEWESQVVYLVSLYDITEFVRLREDFRSVGWLDEVTGFYSKGGFSVLGEQLLHGARRLMKELYLVGISFINLEAIKKGGPHESESAVQDLSMIIKKIFQGAGSFVRLDENTMAVLLTAADKAQADVLCSRLMKQVDFHNKTARKGYTISVKTKIAFYNPRVSATIDSLIEQLAK